MAPSVITPMMSAEFTRLFLASGLCLLVGGVGGAYATRAVYGDPKTKVDPNPKRPPSCAPCPVCPACPPPPECGGIIPPPSHTTKPIDKPSEPLAPAKPGLPFKALKLATDAVRGSIERCTTEDKVGELDGVILLNLTATATGGQGWISEALVTRATGSVADSDIATCVTDAAEEARFEWAESEGELRFKLPVKIGP